MQSRNTERDMHFLFGDNFSHIDEKSPTANGGLVSEASIDYNFVSNCTSNKFHPRYKQKWTLLKHYHKCPGMSLRVHPDLTVFPSSL